MENPEKTEETVEKTEELMEVIKEENTEVIPEKTREGITEEAAEESRGRTLPTQAVLTIRAIVGGYVLYLAYQIITSGSEKSVPMWAVVVLFIIAGAGLVIMSGKHLICGEYEGGKKDENR